MEPLNKKQRRRENLLSQFWLNLYGQRSEPKRYAKQWLRQMGRR